MSNSDPSGTSSSPQISLGFPLDSGAFKVKYIYILLELVIRTIFSKMKVHMKVHRKNYMKVDS